ncbi:MAG TPA: response regulator transcription factor [Fluviicola sp.]|nr:response regulator transcription factor [Fluviicola sp.]
MYHILVIEDEPALSEMIQLNLELEGYEVTTCSNGRVALSYSEKLTQFQLVILDVMLPEVSGLDICRAFRQHSEIPILFLSAKGTTVDRIAGLKLGANDYLPKPFDLEELLLRIQVLLKSNEKEAVAENLVVGDKEVIYATYEVVDRKTNQKELLSKREIELLQLFQSKQDQVVSRDEILATLWGNDQYPTGRTIDNYILNFRKLFETDPKNPRYFHSIRGVGYKFTLPE